MTAQHQRTADEELEAQLRAGQPPYRRDTRPDVTETVRLQERLLELQTEAIATGMLPASQPLYRELCRLAHAADKLRHTCELELTVRIAETERAAAASEGGAS